MIITSCSTTKRIRGAGGRRRNDSSLRRGRGVNTPTSPVEQPRKISAEEEEEETADMRIDQPKRIKEREHIGQHPGSRSSTTARHVCAVETFFFFF